MRIVKVGVLAPTNKGVPLGVQGESCATEVEFDVRPWLREYPSGTVSAVARREGDQAPYPLTLDVADGMGVWVVSDTDTAKAGEGAVELTLTSAGTRVRSLTFKTLVTASLTDAPVDDDAWYGWLDKAVVKVDETVQAAQRKLSEVDQEWTGLKADVNAKVDECSKAAAQAAEDAHRAKVDAKATAKALESAEGSTAKAEAAAKRAEDAAGQAEGFAAQASASEGNASAAVTDARAAQAQAEGFAAEARKSARDAMASQVSANDSAGAAADAAADAEKAKAAAEEAKAAAAVSEGNAATSASDAAESASAAAKSASDAAASVDSINVIAPKVVESAASADGYKALSVGDTAVATGQGSVAIGYKASSAGSESIAIGDTSNATDPFAVALGELSTASAGGSVAVGYNSKASAINEFSVGSDTLTREVTHVSTPTAGTSAATKGYVDLNASNALTATVTDTLVTVDDAVAMPPLSLSFKGMSRQDVTPSVDNPVEVQVVTAPAVTVAGKNLVNIADKVVEVNSIGELVPCAVIPANKTVYVSMMSSGNASPTYIDAASCGMFDDSKKKATYSVLPDSISTGVNKTTITPTFIATKHLMFYGYRLPRSSFTMTNYQLEVGGYSAYEPYSGKTVSIALPEEHPYLASLPDGTADEVIIDAYGNATLVARVGKYQASGDEPLFYDDTAIEFYITGTPIISSRGLSPEFPYAATTRNTFGFATSDQGAIYMSIPGVTTDYDSAVAWVKAHRPTFYGRTATKTYNLGKVSLPSLKAGVSNVWVDGGMGGAVTMTYKRDINKLEVSGTAMRSSSSITVADGTAKVNPAIFGDGLSVTDGQVSVDLDHVGEHLAGDALYYDQTDGLMLKVGQGLHIQNDELDIDQANLPLASAGVRGTVRVGSGLSIDADGVLSATGGGGAVGGCGKLVKATLKTTERVSGIADGEDDVVTDADVPCAVGEMDGALFLTSAPAYRVLRTTYTTGTVMHLEFEWSVDGAQLDQSMLTHAVLRLGNTSTLVPVTTRSVNGKRYKAVEYTATSDIKAGLSVGLKFI